LYPSGKDRITSCDWDLYDCLHSVVRTDHLGGPELEALLRKAYLSFYLSPNKIMDALLSGVRGKGIKLSSIMKIFRGLMSSCFSQP
jgi:hypothetical protein